MNWKLIFLPLAIAIEVPCGLLTGRETGFGNWCLDRELGDPVGKAWQTRERAKSESINKTTKQKETNDR